MPPTFGASIAQVQKFAAKAAYDDKFRERLETNPREVLAEFDIVLDDEDIPEARKLPSKAQCAALLAVLQQYDAFAHGEYDPVAICGFVLFYAFAMPLVPTSEGEVGAAR